MLMKVFENVAGDDMLLKLAAYTSQGNWPIVPRSVFLSFL